MIHRPSHFKFQALAFILFSLLVVQSVTAQESKLPFDVFGEDINNRQVYMYLEEQAKKMVAGKPSNAVEVFRESLDSADRSCKLELESLTNSGAVNKEAIYRHMVKSNMFIGELFNCGRCDRTHVSASGGVVISEDGLVLTNYHVLAGERKTLTEGAIAMAYDGRCFEIQEILAADKAADVALIRLKSDGYKFHAAPIAKVRPQPVESIRIVSHPSMQFYVLTQGEVSRYATNGTHPWMEITADFGGGSSGSGVFNERGEVVGLVSRIRPLISSSGMAAPAKEGAGMNPPSPSYAEMVLRKCVPLKEIHDCFERQDSDASTKNKP